MSYKIFKVNIEAGNMDVSLPEDYEVKGVISQTVDYIVLLCTKYERSVTIADDEAAPRHFTVGQLGTVAY